MKKQDILDALDTKFAATLRVKKADEVAEVAWYRANVLDISGESAIRKNVGFYVISEHSPAETAYWQGGEPKPPPGPITFQQELLAWLGTKIADGTILFYTIIGVLPAVERARVDVTLNVAGSYVETKLGVYKDGANNFQYEVIS